MGVYIKGYTKEDLSGRFALIPEDNIVEVAEPHGRLIDADAMFKDICDYINSMTDLGIFVNDEMLWRKLNHAIEHAPTVIEAEGVIE